MFVTVHYSGGGEFVVEVDFEHYGIVVGRECWDGVEFRG